MAKQRMKGLRGQQCQRCDGPKGKEGEEERNERRGRLVETPHQPKVRKRIDENVTFVAKFPRHFILNRQS